VIVYKIFTLSFYKDRYSSNHKMSLGNDDPCRGIPINANRTAWILLSRFPLWNGSFGYHHLCETNEVSVRDANHLIFLAGPESVSYELKFRWLRQEKDLIKRLIKKRIKVPGCALVPG
jgi:hypothetical protein